VQWHGISKIESRFEVIQLPLWRANEDFLRLLDSFESRLPLRRPSHLASEELSTLLLALGKGTFFKEYSRSLRRRCPRDPERKGAYYSPNDYGSRTTRRVPIR